jgi:hypothetical protein
MLRDARHAPWVLEQLHSLAACQVTETDRLEDIRQCEDVDPCNLGCLKENAEKMPYALDLLRSTASGFLPGDDCDECEADADRLGEVFDRLAAGE